MAKEKKFTKQYDKLNADRRHLPMESFNNKYTFEGPSGKADFLDIFEGHTQLFLYNFMFEPGGKPCVGCSMVVDNLSRLEHLHARDTTLAMVSRAVLEEIENYKKRMGWTFPWYSSYGSSFNEDTGVGTHFRLSVFIRNGKKAFRTYYTTNRGVELLGTVWVLLDLTPLGRQESWEDSPEGRPQTQPYQWWRRHDEYEK